MHNKKVKNSVLVLCIASLLSSCASMQGPATRAAKDDEKIFNQPLRAPKKQNQNDSDAIYNQEGISQSGIEFLDVPQLSLEQAEAQANEAILPTLDNGEISRLTFNNMPVGAFINEVFGNQLGLNFVVEPSVRNARDLVTMRMTNAIEKSAFYQLATKTLINYGVTTSLRDDVLFFSFSENATPGETPLLISGRTLPEVPPNSRPIFQMYPLSAVTTPSVRGWLGQLFPKKELEIKEDPERNSLILIGNQAVVERAIAATKLLDTPNMQGMFSRIIRPSLSSVGDLATNLENVLKTEGIAVRQGAGTAAVRLLPLESVGQLVVFARSASMLEHVLQWADTLETERHSVVEHGLFTYQVQSTQAEHIVQVLNSLGVADFAGAVGGETQTNTGNSSASANQRRSSNSSGNNDNNTFKGKYAVDAQLNTILYSGSGKDWLQILPVIKRLDKPAPSVLVEVILAEVNLNDTETSGINLLGLTSQLGKFDFEFDTAFGLGESGFNLTMDSAGSTRAVLNAFYNNQKASIRSRPRIMVKSGGQASIDVGDEIPVITQTNQSTASGDAPIIETVSYRKTGVLLQINPTVHASGYVDIEISQELSEEVEGASSSSGSPRILTRKLETTVSLRDGGSVLLGGLISSSNSDADNGVPVLGRLPLLGKLFSTDSNTQTRRELMIMIIPYVLNNPDEAESLTDELQRKRIEDISAEVLPLAN